MTNWDKSVTYYPGTKKFYLGAHSLDKGADFTHDSHYEAIAKYNPERAWGDGQIEFIDSGVEIYRQAERAHRNADIDDTSLSNITVVELLREVVRRQWREFNTINAVTRIPVPKLQLNVPITDKYAAHTVPELVEADVKSNVFTQASFSLTKNVVAVYESDESQLKATIEPLQFEIDQAAGALASRLNSQLVTEIETFTTSGKGDWGAMTTNADFSSRDPSDDIVDIISTITDNHFRPNTITMHPRVFADYVTNTHIRGMEALGNINTSGVVPLPHFPGITAVIDVGFTNTVATLYDKSTMLLGEGPTVAENFRDPLKGADGWIIRQWVDPLKVTNDAGRKMTSVSA